MSRSAGSSPPLHLIELNGPVPHQLLDPELPHCEVPHSPDAGTATDAYRGRAVSAQGNLHVDAQVACDALELGLAAAQGDGLLGGGPMLLAVQPAKSVSAYTTNCSLDEPQGKS